MPNLVQYGIDVPIGSGATTRMIPTVIPPLFEPRPIYAEDGRGRFYHVPGAGYAVDTWDFTGRLLRRLTRAHDPVPIDEALVQRYRDRVRAHWDTMPLTGEGSRLKIEHEGRAELPHVAAVPPISQLLASADGTLWAERADLIEEPVDVWSFPPPPPRESVWDRFDPEGRYLGSVSLPPRFRALVVGEDWAVGVLAGELDVQYLARFEVGG
jgi:hypothetical protein